MAALRSLAHDAAADLRAAVATRPIPADGFSPAAPRRRRLTVLAMTAVVVILAAGLVVIIGRGGGTTAPASKLQVPEGFRAVHRPDAGFELAVPDGWRDAQPPEGLGKPLSVFRAGDYLTGTGADMDVYALDVGTMAVRDQADRVANSAKNGAPANNFTETRESIAGSDGFRLEWDLGPNSHQTTFVFKGSERLFQVLFVSTPADTIDKVMHSFRTLDLPPLKQVPRKGVGGDDFTMTVPASWLPQIASPQGEGSTSELIIGGIEGAALVNRLAATKFTMEKAVANAKRVADNEHGSDLRITATKIGGHDATRVDYVATFRVPQFINPPGLRRFYLIDRGDRIIALYLKGPDTARTEQLYDEIAASFALNP